MTEAERQLYDLDEDGILGSGDVQTVIDHLPAAAKAAASQDAWVPPQPTLMAPFPNPFNSETMIVMSLPEPVHAELSVHNLIGQRIRVLRAQPLSAGVNRLERRRRRRPPGALRRLLRRLGGGGKAHRAAPGAGAVDPRLHHPRKLSQLPVSA